MTAEPDLLALAPDAQRLLFRDARTADTFTAEPVTDDQLRAIHDLVRWGPTGANTQPLRIVVVRSPEARERLLPLMKRGNREKTAAAPVSLILAADMRFFDHWDRLNPHKQGAGASFDGSADAEVSARFNGALQAGYVLLGIRAAGLAAGPMAGFDAAAVDAEFFPGGTLRSLLVVNVGHPGPDAWRDRLPRLDYDEVVTTL